MTHCKAPSHLQVVVVPSSSNEADLGETAADYVAHLDCPNATHYNGWGVELVPIKAGAPVAKHAMRLLPAAASWLPDQLDHVAGEADPSSEAVAVQHTFAGIFRTWRTFTPAAAEQLAEEIRAAIPTTPAVEAEPAPASPSPEPAPAQPAAPPGR